jgi:glycosyltransferase involved in cell wall biosynthesis
MRILLITDAWHPQVNGVVRTWTEVKRECEARGHEFEVVAPDRFRTVPMPTYPEIRLALFPARRIRDVLDAYAPDAVHLATEGPLGFAGRRLLLRRSMPFTTSYHTRFPEYVAARAPVPLACSYAVVRRFHERSSGMLVATETMRRELAGRGFANVVPWSRGVDTRLFRPDRPPALDLPKPVFTYVGRVAVEKNIGAFLDLDLPGSKLVVGDGPQLAALKARYPDVHFVGAKFGEALACHYAAGDVFVFPSRTDTFGLVLLEALASGLPVAAYPVTGPLDVVGGTDVAVLNDDLRTAAIAALDIPRDACRAFAERHSWKACAEQFLDNLAVPLAVAA